MVGPARLMARCTVSRILAHLATSEPSRPVLTYYREGLREDVWSVERLLTAVTTAAEDLRNRVGVSTGDRVVLRSGNCPEFVVAALAAMAMGSIVVPVAGDESSARIRYIADNCGATALLYDQSDEAFRGPDQAEVGVACHSLQQVCRDFDSAGRPPLKWNLDLPHSLPAALLYTSGTTGRPKGVTLTHYNLAVNAEALVRAHGIRAGSSHVCVLPLHHANAFGFSMISTLYARAHLVLCDTFPVFGLAKIMNAEQADLISVVPQILGMWLRRPIRARDVPSLRYVVSAAAPLRTDVAREFLAATGLRIHQGYGLSECTNFATAIEHDISAHDYDRLMHSEAVPSVGAAVFGVRCAVVGGDGKSLPEGVEGEIVVRGDSVMSGYWGDDAATAEALGDGYLRTGDRGYWRLCDGMQYFFVTGRIKELIVRAGSKISPREVEDELALSSDHAVVGFAHEATGEEVGLYIAASLSHAEREALAARLICLPFSRRPKLVLYGCTSVPRTATGKVRRKLLADRFESYRHLPLTTNDIVFMEAHD